MSTMDNDNPNLLHDPLVDSSKGRGYALSGKIMLSAIVILFAVVVFMVGLHLYARWYLLSQRRREILRRRRVHHRRTHIVFYVDNPNSGLSDAANRGLEPAVLNSLPAFVYSDKTHPEPLECAVCLSEFDENEKGRVLPKCNHSFHLACIDMWFHSHSTCPLCRSPVEPSVIEPSNNPVELAVTVTEPGSSSRLCSTCQHGEENNNSFNTTPLGVRRKGLDLTGVRIEVPRRNELEDELEMGLRLSSPASQLRSPAARLLSLRRIISMNKKTPTGAASNSPGVGTSCAAEFDIESGGGGTIQAGEPTPVISNYRSPRSCIGNDAS